MRTHHSKSADIGEGSTLEVRFPVRVAAGHRLLLDGLAQDDDERYEVDGDDEANNHEEIDVNFLVVQVPAIREPRRLLGQTVGDVGWARGGDAVFSAVQLFRADLEESADAGQERRGGDDVGRLHPAVRLVRDVAGMVSHRDGCNRKAHKVLELEDGARNDLRSTRRG